MEDEVILKKIIDRIDLKELEVDENIALLTGSSGTLVFLVLYAVVKKDSKMRLITEKILDNILDKLVEKPNESPSHCEGLCGIAWLLLYLEEIGYMENETDEFFLDCDRYLSVFSNLFMKEEKWDLLYGSMGIGFYYLKRNNIVEVEKIIMFLDDICIREGDEIKFKRFEPHFSRTIYDTGFAHGNAGILAFLSKAYRYAILPEVCSRLIRGLISFYKNNILDYGTEGSFWEDFLEVDENIKTKQTYSRLAWCYGDLMILNSLYAATGSIGDEENGQLFLQMLKTTTDRQSYERTLVKDPHLCHGSSGAALIYGSLFFNTGEELFRQAEDYWIDVTKSSFDPTGSLNDKDGKLTVPFISENKSEALEGLAGIGLVILSRLYRDQLEKDGLNKWKEMLFIFDQSSE